MAKALVFQSNTCNGNHTWKILDRPAFEFQIDGVKPGQTIVNYSSSTTKSSKIGITISLDKTSVGLTSDRSKTHEVKFTCDVIPGIFKIIASDYQMHFRRHSKVGFLKLYAQDVLLQDLKFTMLTNK